MEKDALQPPRMWQAVSVRKASLLGQGVDCLFIDGPGLDANHFCPNLKFGQGSLLLCSCFPGQISYGCCLKRRIAIVK